MEIKCTKTVSMTWNRDVLRGQTFQSFHRIGAYKEVRSPHNFRKF